MPMPHYVLVPALAAKTCRSTSSFSSHELGEPKPNQQGRFSLLGQLSLKQPVKSITVVVKAPFLAIGMPHTPVTLFLCWARIDLKCKKINLYYVCMQS